MTENTIGMITRDWYKTAIGAAREFKLNGYIAEGAFKNEEYCGFAREIQRREDDQGYKIEYYLTNADHEVIAKVVFDEALHEMERSDPRNHLAAFTDETIKR